MYALCLWKKTENFSEKTEKNENGENWKFKMEKIICEWKFHENEAA